MTNTLTTNSSAAISEHGVTSESIDALNEFAELLTHADSPLRAQGIIWSELLVLATLDKDRRSETASKMSEVAARVGLSRAAMTSSADRLEQKMLIQRRPHPTDRRTTMLGITGFGIQLLEAAFGFSSEAVAA